MATKAPPPPVPRPAPTSTAGSHNHPGYYAVRSGKGGLKSCIFLHWQHACRFVEDDMVAINSNPRPDVAAFQDVSDAVEWLLEGDACAGENREDKGSAGSGGEKEGAESEVDAVTVQLPPPPPIRPGKRERERELPTAAAAATAPEPRKKRGRPTKKEALLRDEQRREQGKSQAERKRKDEDDYDPPNWSEKLEQLRRFKEGHGHLDIPLDYPVLGPWAERQRAAYRRKCDRERREKLRSKNKMENLEGSADGVSAKEKAGDQEQFAVPSLPPMEIVLEGGGGGEEGGKEKTPDEPAETAEGKTESGSAQKEGRTSTTSEKNDYADTPSVSPSKSKNRGRPSRKDAISDAHIADLREIGFEPRKSQTKTLESIVLGTSSDRCVDDAKWEEMFEKYKNKPKGQNDRVVHSWSSQQRLNYRKFLEGKKSPLNHDRIRRLMQLGFVFETTRKRSFVPQKFEDRLQQFIDHKKTNPFLDTTPMSKELQSWIGSTRKMATAYNAGRKSTMTAERLTLLQQAGFPFATKNPTKEERVLWDERFEQLLAFKAVHGHCNVHKDYEGGLGTWVRQQRGAYRNTNNGKKKLTEERALHNQKLNDIGFVWKMQR